MSEIVDVAIIGAGFAGLGTGAGLRARGIENFVLLEKGDRAGFFWSTTYERLHLHSAFHDMPHDGGLRTDYPMFLSRNDVVDYLGRYAKQHDLVPHIHFDTNVTRVDRPDGEATWELQTSRGTIRARFVAVATAMNRIPHVPAFPGIDVFEGCVLHSHAYANSKPFAGHRVLVVGSGNSAAEIALDLSEGGARDVAMWVRAPRHFIPLKRMGRLFRVLRFLGVMSDEANDEAHRISVGDPRFEKMARMRDGIVGRLAVDLSKYGIQRPEVGPFMDTYLNNRIPTFDQGTISAIKRGDVRVIDGNERPINGFVSDGVELGDRVETFDDVILATGYEPGLEEFIAEETLLAPALGYAAYPRTDGRCRSSVDPTLFFPGFDRTPLGGFSLGRWGWEIADVMAAALDRA